MEDRLVCSIGGNLRWRNQTAEPEGPRVPLHIAWCFIMRLIMNHHYQINKSYRQSGTSKLAFKQDSQQGNFVRWMAHQCRLDVLLAKLPLPVVIQDLVEKVPDTLVGHADKKSPYGTSRYDIYEKPSIIDKKDIPAIIERGVYKTTNLIYKII